MTRFFRTNGLIARIEPGFAALRASHASFCSNVRGNVAIMFGLASAVLVVAVGCGIDLSRAYYARQKLSEVATLTCQYSARPSVIDVNTGGSSGFAAYKAAVNTFAASSLSQQNWNGTTPTGAAGGAGGSIFTATEPTGSSVIPTNPVVDISANIPASFLQIAHITQIPVHAQVNCLNATISTTFNATHTGGDTPSGSGGCTGYCFTRPDGTTGTNPTSTSTFPANASYTDPYQGDQWYILGYCLEVDQTGAINSTTPEGSHSFELDCDNGSNSAGNSSMSMKKFLPTGYYELRYFYRSRITYPNYDPTYLCASTAADLSWANDTTTSGFHSALRTNQINVYLDENLNGTPPLHTTLDHSQQLAGSNLIDQCVDSSNWIERSVKINVTKADYYWLSFAADGDSDSYGGQIDNIRLCLDNCTNSPVNALALQDNFPAQWLAANNGNQNKVLFEDTFENPTYWPDYSNYINKGGNLVNSQGVTVTTCGYAAPPGWPCASATGWGTAPYNEVNYFLQGAQQGSQYISIDGWNGYSSGSLSRNRLISRPFLLDPGYYQVSYYYVSGVDFSTTQGANQTVCTAAPTASYIYRGVGSYPSSQGINRFTWAQSTTDNSTNILGAFMSHGALVSTPNVANAPWATSANTNYSAPALGAATSYTNPDGSVSTTAVVPPDNVNWANYNSAAVNPVIDTCSYVPAYRWNFRSVSIKITKPGVYWLTFSANGGTADGNGPGIDDVKLTALGSPYMTNPPSSPLVAIPVPDPQPDTNYTNGGQFTGFYTVADPFKPTAADQ